MKMKWVVGLGILSGIVIAGCPNLAPTTNNDNTTDNTNSSTDGNDNSSDNTNDDVAISGTLQRESDAQASQATNEAFLVVAQSAQTMAIFYGQADSSGNFEIDLPDEEKGNIFLVTIVSGNSQVAGPVIFGTSGDDGFTGLEVDGGVNFGTIIVPDNPDMDPIMVGSDNDIPDGMVQTDVFAHLDANGVPVGVPSNGKGEDAEGNTTNNPNQACDMDQDGLIDMYDADNNGNGIVDEFDDEGTPGGEPDNADIRGSFFMNLKIPEEKSDTYFDGTVEEIEAALASDTIITFEIIPQTGSTKTVTGVALFAKTAPTYIEGAEVTVPADGGGSVKELWVDMDYAFTPGPDGRWQAFVTPNALINAGDTFTVEVTFDDGSTLMYSRMINFVFTNIPRLVKVGATGSLSVFVGVTPIQFDGTQDVVVEFEPPVDEDGNVLTEFNYFFEVFYNGADGQLNGDIDADATFTTEIDNWRPDNQNLEIDLATLGSLSADGTYTVTLPKEIFVDSVELMDGSTEAVTSYKIDIAAQSAGNNAAILLGFEKQ